MRKLGRVLALVCAIDAALVVLQFARDFVYGRRPAPPLDYNDCLNLMLDLYHNDCLAPMADIAEEN